MEEFLQRAKSKLVSWGSKKPCALVRARARWWVGITAEEKETTLPVSCQGVRAVLWKESLRLGGLGQAVCLHNPRPGAKAPAAVVGTWSKLGAVHPACSWRDADPAKATVCPCRLEDKWVWCSLREKSPDFCRCSALKCKRKSSCTWAGGDDKT